MNLGWSTMVSMGFAIVVITAYWWRCWKCRFSCLNLCDSILLRIFAHRSTSRGNECMSKKLDVDSGEAIRGILLRKVVKVHVVFWWVRDKKRHWAAKQQGRWAGCVTAQVPGQWPPTQSRLLRFSRVPYKWSSCFMCIPSQRRGSTGLLHSFSPKGQEEIALAY